MCVRFFNQDSVILYDFFLFYSYALLSRSHSPYFIHTRTLTHSNHTRWAIEETIRKKNSIRQIQTELCCAWTCQTFRLLSSYSSFVSFIRSFDYSFVRSLVRCAKCFYVNKYIYYIFHISVI